MRIILAILTASAALAQVGSMSIKEASGSTQAGRPITFGRPFKQGDIANFPQPRINGVPAAQYQVDLRNRWDADSSVKYAVISFLADLPANGTIAIDFVDNANPCHLGNQATCDAAALDGAGMLAQRSSAWTATIEITNGTTQTANARTMISGGKFTSWLKGPIVTQMIVRDTTRASDMGFASGITGLHPIFVITAYPGYTAGMRQEFTMENSWTDKLIDQVYSLAIKNGAGGATTAYSHSSMTHYAMSRWHRGDDAVQIWDGTAPGLIEINHNPAYLTSTRALPNWDPNTTLQTSGTHSLSGGYTSFLLWDQGEYGGTCNNAATASGCGGGVERGMTNTGGRKDIGFIHHTLAKTIYSSNANYQKILQAYSRVAGHVPIHIREARSDNLYCAQSCTGGNATLLAYGLPIHSESRPTFDGLGFTNGSALDKITFAGTTTKGGWTWDGAHHPSLSYLPYLQTGSWHDYQEILFWSSYTTVDNTPYYRGYEQGLSIMRGAQMRKIAWHNRTLAQAAFVALDGSAERQLLLKRIDNNAEMWEGILNITTGTFPPADSACPGYTAGVLSFPPQGSPQQSAWCSGRMVQDSNRVNAINFPLGAHYTDCQKDNFSKFDCLTGSNFFHQPWQVAYLLYNIGWEMEAVSTAYSNVFAAYMKMYIDVVADSSLLKYSMLGGSFSYGLLSLKGSTYPTSIADYNSIVVKSGSTTTTGAMTTSSTIGQTVTVADVSQLAWAPIWRRPAAQITAITATDGTVKIGFTTAHGLAVGTRIEAAGHSNAAFNTNNVNGGYISDPSTIRNVSGVPSSTEIEFLYIGTTPPANGSYTVDSGYVVATASGSVIARIGSELLNVCGVDPGNNTLTLGQGSSTDTIAATRCPVSGFPARGAYGTAIATHSSGTTITPAYDVWYQVDTSDWTSHYNLYGRDALSFAYPYTTGSSTGAAAWTWLETNMMGVAWSGASGGTIGSGSRAFGDPIHQMLPRGLASFTITTAGLASGLVNAAYSQTITTSGATGAVTCALQSGTLPTGITLTGSTCTLAGTPTATYSQSITIRATDSTAAFRDATYGLSITAPSGPTISTLSLPDGTVGSSYLLTMAATGGTAPYSWSVIGTALPAGLGLAANGVLSGNPSVGNAPAAAFSVTIRVTDAGGLTYDRVYSLTINWITLTITTAASLPSGTIGTPYSYALSYAGGNGSNVWTPISGTFPAGLNLFVGSGLISGTPNTAATYSFTVQVQSGDGQTASKAFTLDVPQPTEYQKFLRSIKAQGVIVK